MERQNDGYTLLGCDRCRRGFPPKEMIKVEWPLVIFDSNYALLCRECAYELKQWIAAGVHEST